MQRRSRSSSVCCACQKQQQTAPIRQQQVISRRDLALAAPAVLLLSAAGRAAALEAEAAAPASAAEAAPSTSSSSISSLPSADLQLFIDNDYELQVPSNYAYLATEIQRVEHVPSNYAYLATEIQRVERGPQPERSPVLGRFEAPNGQPGLITILTRRAQAFKQTLLQVTDISQLGDPIAVAQLLLPRGSTLLATVVPYVTPHHPMLLLPARLQVTDISQLGEPIAVAQLLLPRGSTLLATATQQVPQPPKETPLGLVEIPPQNYFLFEFTTNTGLHVAMAAAAKKGSVLICGASTTKEQWAQAGPVLSRVVKSFRLRSQQGLAAL
ncbi:hypothetical protein OEZ85_009568 [Tetradesmus obliquus]|uniref:PsbP C-terminal domain-containing protein n=1 Tax=Tetradesmus obliquus TaxID=3088 RepID=A0ABY8U9G2_TETOB|nr:hypothetical protein OEZ85_009568 [Tetradesmus obliquus]